MLRKRRKHDFRPYIPVMVGGLASLALSGIYLGFVSWAESLDHALELFWTDAWLIIPMLIGFGIQTSLYTVLKMRLHIPKASVETGEAKTNSSAPGASIATGGTTSTAAMVACCVHHLTDVLPILGLTAASTFLTKYQVTFMWVGLMTNLTGIGVILFILKKERKTAVSLQQIPLKIQEEAC